VELGTGCGINTTVDVETVWRAASVKKALGKLGGPPSDLDVG
jgi:hypothetical protein